MTEGNKKALLPIASALAAVIRAYRAFVSPFLGRNCRFYPSCSQYAEEAVLKQGAFKGSLTALCRLIKCNPFHPGGYDPL